MCTTADKQINKEDGEEERDRMGNCRVGKYESRLMSLRKVLHLDSKNTSVKNGLVKNT